jgi:phosphomethylpyrimidine synthase
MTQMRLARAGTVSPAMRRAAERERLVPEVVRNEIAAGRMIVPANPRHVSLEPIVIGRRTRVKINANVGNSPISSSLDEEMSKVHVALQSGADTVMDLSTGTQIEAIREAILAAAPAPVGTVPMYEAVQRAKRVEDVTAELLLGTIVRQAEQGVDFMTLHPAMLAKHLRLCLRRVTGIVSRGGGLLAHWMGHHGRENPLYEQFDDVLAICAEHGVALSLGNGLRPGSIADATDAAQLAELDTLGELTARAWDQDVQVMVEGPGHMPMDQVEANVLRQRRICQDAPFFTRGPLVTDVAPAYDHIASAIGSAIAGWHGTALLCCVTPKAHLGPEGLEHVRQGLIASRIAAHAADLARGCPHAYDRDWKVSAARFAADWARQFELALNPDTARTVHDAPC